MFPTNTWLQFQLGADLPHDTSASPQSLFYYTAIGQTFASDHRLGRQWSPMVEFLANRDLEDGAKTDWDVMPEMQVTVSRRQHVRLNVGVRQPFTDTGGRNTQVYFYCYGTGPTANSGRVGNEDPPAHPLSSGTVCNNHWRSSRRVKQGPRI